MEYFLNYGGLIIFGFVAYLALFWLWPLLMGHRSFKSYFINVLFVHLFVIIVLWVGIGIQKLALEKRENPIGDYRPEYDRYFEN